MAYTIRLSQYQLVRIRDALAAMAKDLPAVVHDDVLAPTDPQTLVDLCDMTLAQDSDKSWVTHSWLA